LAVVDESGTQMAFTYDANGNVGQLVDEQGGVVARYEYDAFGQTLVAAGSAAEENAYRFSTKMVDVETGLVGFEHRHYLPGVGRWLTRDPIGEKGGLNLFAFVNNAPTDATDYLGLYRILVRIDVPGQNPSGPGDHQDMVIDDTDTGHAWVVFDPECGKGKLSVGWYPAKTPFFGSDYHNGVAGQVGDDSQHHYEYEYVVEKVSKERYEAALREALSARGSWSEKNSCTNFVIEVTRAAGIDVPATWQTYNPNFVIGPVTFVFPGRLAKDLHAAGKGRYKVGGSAGRPADGSSGKGLGNDPHTSPPLPAGLRDQWFPKPVDQKTNDKQSPPTQPNVPSPGTP
jgi:RHS repeat-associated protein